MRIALFITCFTDMMFPRAGRAVTEQLERLGHTVEFPQGQTCRGQMHFNTGYRPETLPMVRRFAESIASIRQASSSCPPPKRHPPRRPAVVGLMVGAPAMAGPRYAFSVVRSG